MKSSLKRNPAEKNLIDANSQKHILIQMLAHIAKIASDNDIDYSLIGGSLIGAVRHSGMIPWDDDIDIILDAKNYKKLIKALKVDSGKYLLLDADSEETYYYPYAKLVDSTTSMNEIGCKPIKNYGIYIDIFCYHNAPKTRIGKIIHYYNIQRYKIIFSGYAHCKIKKEYKYAMLKRVGKIYAETVGIKKILKRFNKMISKYDQRNADMVISNWAMYGWKKEYQEKKNILNYEFCSFDDVKAKIFSSYDAILCKTFGDYMTPPPKEERIAKHSTIAIYKEEEK